MSFLVKDSFDAGTMTTWRKLILRSLTRNDEVWEDIEAIDFSIVSSYAYSTLTLDKFSKLDLDQRLDFEFDTSHGTPNCPIRFQAWTANFIYFSYEYDGKDFVVSKPRNPDTGDVNFT